MLGELRSSLFFDQLLGLSYGIWRNGLEVSILVVPLN